MLAVFLCVLSTPLYLITSSKPAHSCFCGYVPTTACDPADCAASALPIPLEHSACLNGGSGQGCSGTPILQHIGNEFDTHENWLENTFVDIIVEAMKKMAVQLTAVSMNQTMNIGMFFDAKESLETNRLMQELQVQAHEDYQPSESFCTFGTAVRSMAHTEEIGNITKKALTTRQMARQLGLKNTGGGDNRDIDKKNRWNYFTNYFCDPKDNNWVNGESDTGLSSICEPINTRTDQYGDPIKRKNINIDIDYTRNIDYPKTLNIDGVGWTVQPSNTELNMMALSNNLYGHNVLTRNLSERNIASNELASLYLELRGIAAKRSVAENSFNSIVAMKSLGSSFTGSSDTHLYLGKILQDLGIPQDEVTEYLGIDLSGGLIGQEEAVASYYATMEILTKKIFQNPTFYANLYDTPANVQRKAAALKAFDLMLDRSIYESQLRREMAMSVLLASRIESHQKARPSEVWGK